MDRGRLKALFNVEDDDDEDVPQAFQRKPVDESKVVAFTQATARKSKKQKEEEAAEQKRRQHELETSQVFEEYVADFSAAPRPKGSLGFVRAGESTSAIKNTTSKGIGDEILNPMEPPAQKPKGKRAMDAFLEEIKRDQAAREQRLARQSYTQGSSVTSLAAYESQTGSRDRGDPETCNLFVAHLPENVTEDALGEYFGQIGEVTSVKIMWPRGDNREGPGNDLSSRRGKSGGLSGFVSFMRRKDAEAALRELDGRAWAGSTLRVGWSKAVPTSGKVLYGHRHSRSRSPSPRRSYRQRESRSRSHSHSSDHSRDRPRHRSRSYEKRDRDRRSRAYSSHSRSRSRNRSNRKERHRRSHSSPRLSKDEEDFITMVAGMTRTYGYSFEDALKERERENPLFEFLFSSKSSAFRFYEDIVDPNSNPPYEFNDDGDDEVYSTDNEEIKESERGPRNKLGPLAARRFKAMLRAMVGKRGEVARSMAFCLEHGEAASEVVNIIISSLLVSSTPVPRKMARLHLISDIVHNSAVTLPSAWKYRQEFQHRLGLVFDHLSAIYHSFSGRMTAETFKRQVMAVIDVWDDRIVFPPHQTAVWKDRLDGKEPTKQVVVEVEERHTVQQVSTSARFKSAFKPVVDPEGEVDMDLDDEDDKPQEAPAVEAPNSDTEREELDGAPIIDEDIDGEALDDDVDGAPLEDVDGDPLDDDVDGAPVDLE